MTDRPTNALVLMVPGAYDLLRYKWPIPGVAVLLGFVEEVKTRPTHTRTHTSIRCLGWSS